MRGIRWQIQIEDKHLAAIIERIDEGVGEKFQVIQFSIHTIETHLAIIERIEEGVGDVHSVTSVSMLRHKSVAGNLSLTVKLRRKN